MVLVKSATNCLTKLFPRGNVCFELRQFWWLGEFSAPPNAIQLRVTVEITLSNSCWLHLKKRKSEMVRQRIKIEERWRNFLLRMYKSWIICKPPILLAVFISDPIPLYVTTAPKWWVLFDLDSTSLSDDEAIFGSIHMSTRLSLRHEYSFIWKIPSVRCKSRTYSRSPLCVHIPLRCLNKVLQPFQLMNCSSMRRISCSPCPSVPRAIYELSVADPSTQWIFPSSSYKPFCYKVVLVAPKHLCRYWRHSNPSHKISWKEICHPRMISKIERRF